MLEHDAFCGIFLDVRADLYCDFIALRDAINAMAEDFACARAHILFTAFDSRVAYGRESISTFRHGCDDDMHAFICF